jgi:alkylation response protein AidB-like acyl-CoA dehydrogenase
MQPASEGELGRYREAIRAHVARHRPDMDRLPGTRSPEREDLPNYQRWCASLFEAGFLGADWPAEWGGQDLADPMREFVLDEELAEAKVPRPIGSWNLVSHAILARGSAEQKRRHLPRIRSFEDLWCQLFSEPEAGSDLAALRTTARRDEGGWVIDGQKVWTTHAHVADMGFLLARTDSSSKHGGISAFVIDMNTPGIDVRPLREMTGSSDFNEVFFDGARIPADALIGEPGQGWAIAREALSHERLASLREDSVVEAVRRLVRHAAATLDGEGPLTGRSDVRRSLGGLYARAKASDLLGRESVTTLAAGTGNSYDSSVVKVLFSEVNLDVASYALELLGAEGALTGEDPDVIDGGFFQKSFLYSRGFTISAGSNEIMRNLIAERGLGLPR